MLYEDLPELDLCELRLILESSDDGVAWLEEDDGWNIRLWKAEISPTSVLPVMTPMVGLVPTRSAHAG